MSYRSWEVALGALVLAVAVIFVIFAIQTTGTQLRSAPGYALTASFRSAEGVRPGTEVRLAGVRVGTVTGMELDPESFHAQVTISLQEGLRLPADSTIQVAAEGLLGGTFIDILPGGSPFDMEPGQQFEDTQSAVSLVQLMLRFATGGGSDAGANGASDAEAFE